MGGTLGKMLAAGQAADLANRYKKNNNRNQQHHLVMGTRAAVAVSVKRYVYW
jgi:hypothetical protein